jgi:eukaryotic-like serine/threonine-protein kinase
MKAMRKVWVYSLWAAALTAAEPAMFRGDAAHGGVYAGAAPAIAGAKWKFKTGAKVLSSPAVCDGTVYIGSGDRNLYALAAADGTVRWKFATGGRVNSSPAVAEGLVYVNSLDGNFYAVDAETGKLRWKFQTGGERRFTAPGIHGAMPRTEAMPDPYDVFLSSPAVAGGAVYFGSGDRNVYALDARSGELKWKFTTGNVVHASPAVAGGVVYIGSWDRNLYALDAGTGAAIWKF